MDRFWYDYAYSGVKWLYSQQCWICSWSISRGLARGSTEYKRLFMAADEPRKGDLDGRGALSQSALIDFCAFFLECCFDQVRYMRELPERSELQCRMELCADEEDAERLPKRSFGLLREALLSGALERGRVCTRRKSI